jgi:hypothetical protein
MMFLLGLGAISGWGSFAVSSRFSSEAEAQLRAQITTLQVGQEQLLVDRSRSEAAVAELAQLRHQLSSAQDEITRLTRDRGQAQLKMPAVRPPLTVSSSMPRLSQNEVPQAGSTASLPPTPPHAPARLAQAALTKSESGLMIAQAAGRKRQPAELGSGSKPVR